MTRFLLIDAKARTSRVEDLKTFEEAKAAVGLDKVGTDHGVISRGLSVVVDEFGLFAPRETTAYFSLRQQLYAGNAVLYRYDGRGETIDVDAAGTFSFDPPSFLTGDEAEAACQTGMIFRPTITVGGEVRWAWPAPRPEFMHR